MGVLESEEVTLTADKSGIPPIARMPPLSSMVEELRLRANENIRRTEPSFSNMVLMIDE